MAGQLFLDVSLVTVRGEFPLDAAVKVDMRRDVKLLWWLEIIRAR